MAFGPSASTRVGRHSFSKGATIGELTEPLRADARLRLKGVETQLERAQGDMELVRKREILKAMARSPWLFLGTSKSLGWGAVQLGRSDANAVLQQLIKKHGIRDQAGKIVSITLSDLRDAWIGYAYANSGYSWLVAKLAAGHSDPATLRSYLRQRQWRVHGERQTLRLQDALWKEIRARRLIEPSTLRTMVEQGEITEEQRSRWETHKDRTRMGTGCRAPRHPPPRIAPDHAEGEVCRVQRCVICQHSLIFQDSFDGFACRKAELIYIRETMPVSMWLQSTWSDEAEVLDENLTLFNPEEVATRSAQWLADIRTGKVHLFDQEGSYADRGAA